MLAYLSQGPAHEAISYQVVSFHNDAGEATIYQQKPSPEVDEAWEDLYRCTSRLAATNTY